MRNKVVNFICIDAVMLALLCASAFSISIEPLKFTLQLLIVFVIGLLLPLKDALIVLISYIILGLIGLPIFGGYQGGLQYISFPTFGFVYGFIPGVIALEFIKRLFITSQNKNKKILGLIIALIACQLICYIFGFIHGYYILNIKKGAEYTFFNLMMLFIIPYIPIDLIKVAIALVIYLPLEKQYEQLLS